MPGKTYKKSFATDPKLLPEIEEYVVEIAKEAKLDENKFNNVALAVAEASSNCMLHGNKMDSTKFVHVEVSYDERFIVIKFRDQGNGFDLKGVPDPTKPENILKDSGRGIHIMRSFLDDLKYNFTDEGTEVIMTLKLN